MDWRTTIEVAFGLWAGGYTGKLWMDRRTLREVLQDRREVLASYRANLTALRRNAFITNARGHRVRYVNATPDEQARAESND